MKDEKLIDELLHSCEYATLALIDEKGMPYCVPVNYVHADNCLYFHGSHSGRKMRAIKNTPFVSLSVVKNYSIIASYFSSTEGLACPATQFFQSISIEAKAFIVEDRDEKAQALTLLMQKLQPEGKYKPFEDSVYDKMLKATAVIRLDIISKNIKLKFGQKLTQERFDRILQHLSERSSSLDLATIEMMKATYKSK